MTLQFSPSETPQELPEPKSTIEDGVHRGACTLKRLELKDSIVSPAYFITLSALFLVGTTPPHREMPTMVPQDQPLYHTPH